MKLENLGKNQTRLIMQIQDHKEDFTWDKDIYFSYGTPVLIVNYRNAEIHETIERYSSTTSKHLNAFKRMSNRYDERGGPVHSHPYGGGREWTTIQANEHRMRTVAGQC